MTPTSPRVLGPDMCVPFGKLLRGHAVPNTVTKTVHTDKVFTQDLRAQSIEAFPHYPPLRDQIRTIKSFGRPVVLVDDLLHTGNRIRVIDPNDIDNTIAVFKEELYVDEPSLIITQAPCVLNDKSAVKAPLHINPDACKNCRSCLKLGCPAIESADKKTKPAINPQLCTGCAMCQQVCKFNAISKD